MKYIDILEKIMNENMSIELRNALLSLIVNETTVNGERKTPGIPRLKNCPVRLDCDEAFSRMKTLAGGTGVGVAKLLGISPQAVNNQIHRKALSGNSLLELHYKTGASLDWLAASWDGDTSDYYYTAIPGRSKLAIGDDRRQKYLCLVETYNQLSGAAELKWALTKRHALCDDNNESVSEDFGALYSLIVRYKNEAGTPARVRSGDKHHFQVRRVVAYILGEAKLVRRIDGLVKKLTAEHISGSYERPGKTEFRTYSSKEDCVFAFTQLATEHGMSVIRPVNDAIAWDFLTGSGCMKPRDWVISRYQEAKKSLPPAVEPNNNKDDPEETLNTDTGGYYPDWIIAADNVPAFHENFACYIGD